MIICFCSLLILFHPKEDLIKATNRYMTSLNMSANTENDISKMEGLDLIQERYAANFEKVYYEDTKEYYYKLPEADFYLAYEGTGDTEQLYLYHLYEVVLDEPDTGLGHTVTYGWYTVNQISGVIKDQTQ
jgi:hypothetical protein